MKDKRQETLGILLIALALLILFSLLGHNQYEDPQISPAVQIENPMGIMGVFISYYLIKLGFGFSTILIPLLVGFWGWKIFGRKKISELVHLSSYIIITMMLISVSLGYLEYLSDSGDDYGLYLSSGLTGGVINQLLLGFLGKIGTGIILVAGWLIIMQGYFPWNYRDLFNKYLGDKYKSWKTNRQRQTIKKKAEISRQKHTKKLLEQLDDHEKSEKRASSEDLLSNKLTEDSVDPAEVIEKSDIESESEYIEPGTETIAVDEKVIEDEVDLDAIKERQTPKRTYQLPSTDLLYLPAEVEINLTKEELIERANFLTQALSTFGVEGTVVNVSPGPVITLFEVEPAEGVRVNKFVQLSDDLARVMEASRVRVIAPIPGKSSVGIEIPNRNPEMVYFKSSINSEKFANSKSLLSLAMGKFTNGEISVIDLASMPHLLIAGTTGSGKSVCLNNIICSILYQANPDEVKFIIIDPKKVEMSLFRSLENYHLLGISDIDEPIVTSTDNAIFALRALEKEMDRRYNVLAEAVVRNIDEYNIKMRAANKTILPYIVLVVDELADLMMMSAKDVEAPIARLAQLARAVGLHLVIATQRPSVDVITGVIKANFPARIAFQVATKIDSRTILDTMGAEKLIGRGDMLYLGPGTSQPVRMHGAFISLEEIEAVMKHVRAQPQPEEMSLASIRESAVTDFAINGGSSDDLFDDAVKLVVTHQQGSISLLQRRLSVGYARAARLIDQMEQAGIVGPFTGSKAREVLVDDTYLEQYS